MPAPAAVLQVLVTANTAQANAALARTQAELNATAATAEKSAAKTSGAMASFNKGIASLAKQGPLALGAFAVASVKMSIDFEDAMSQIQTQAGASADEVKKLTPAILDLAKASEFGPTELAKGLFRVESAGIRGARAMKILKAATDLADVGHSDLEETTRAYVAAVKSGIKGTQDFNKAAGLMNAIVGQGSMRMGDLVGAFGTGLLPRAKAVGLSLDQVGAALGVLTEQGMGATQSATRLGMTFSKMVGKPTAEAADSLEKLNIKQGTMARMLLEPNGLVKVLELLHDRLQKLPEAERSATISSMFGGGRSSAAIQILINSLDDYTTKLTGVRAKSKDFNDAIERDNETTASIIAAAWANIQATMTEFGMHVSGVIVFFVRLANKSAAFRAVLQAVAQTFKQMTNPIGALQDMLGKLGIKTGGLGDTFRKVSRGIGNALDSVVSAVKGLVSAVGSAFGSIITKVGNLIDKFGGLKATVGGVARAIQGPVVAAFHAIKDAADAVVRTVTKVISVFKQAASAPKDILDKGLGILGLQSGGVIVPGKGSGDTVPALLEPGEVVWNKKAVQAAGGAARVNQMNKAVPRFASGGLVGNAQSMVGQGTDLMKLSAAALMVLMSKMGVGGGNAAGLLKAAQRMSAKHQPYLWGGGHAGFSRNGPWDCSGAVSQILHEAGFPISAPMVSGALASYGLAGLTSDGKTGIYANSAHTFMSIAGKGYGTSAENPGGGFGGPLSYNSRPGFAKRHPDMSHVSGRTGQAAARGFQLGGIVSKFASGGIAGYNKSYPRGGGPAIPFQVAAAIGESVGQPGITVAQIAKGESTLHPGAVSPDGGYGLLQMTPRVQSSATVRAWEAIGSYFNPFKNVKMSKLLPMGPSTYFGSQYVTGWNQHYTGNLGKNVKPPPKTKGKVPKGSDPAGAGEPAWSLALPSSLTGLIASLGGDTGKIWEAGEFASRAATFGTVGGKNEVQWILEQLKLMEQLREAYIAMILYIKAQIDKFQEAIQRAKMQIAKLKQGKMTAAKGKTIKELQAKIGKWTGRRDISRGALTGEEGPLVGLGALQDPVAGKAFERAVGLNLADKALWGVFGGSVGEAQSQLKSAQETLAADTGSTADTGAASAPDNSALIALLQDQANNLAKQLYVSEQSYAVLAQTPFAGSFAKGGVVPGPIGAPRMAMVHGGESIGQPTPIVIVVQDGAVNSNYIRAVSGKQAEQMARRAGRGRIPGRAGSMT